MHTIDWSSVLNLFISSLIGLIFGAISGWITHKYQRVKDDLDWEREKVKMYERFDHEKELMELEFKQKLLESQTRAEQEKSNQIRANLTKGLDDVGKELNNYDEVRKLVAHADLKLQLVSRNNVRQILDYMGNKILFERITWLLLGAAIGVLCFGLLIGLHPLIVAIIVFLFSLSVIAYFFSKSISRKVDSIIESRLK